MITVLGASGFIGSHLVQKLSEQKIHFYAPNRNTILKNKDLGDIIYCIGLTSDFRTKPSETVEAHVCFLNKVLKDFKFKTLTYLSSTRVYVNSKKKKVDENTLLNISINESEDLYNLTKLTGERLCLSSGRITKIARLSNVYGNDFDSNNFIFNLLNEIKTNGSFELLSSLNSAKDYISIESVTDLLIKIAKTEYSDIYNVANGQNISNHELLLIFEKYFNFEFSVSENSRTIIHPKININKIKKQFDFISENTKVNLHNLIKNHIK